MINRLREISLYVVGGLFLSLLSWSVGSEFLKSFLEQNLVTILIALLAINITTSSILIARLAEIAKERKEASFEATVAALKYSISEQIVFIMIALLVLILGSASWFSCSGELVDFIYLGMLSAILCASVFVLYDTAKAVFDVMSID